MTRHFGTYEAKTKLSELLDLVEKGEEVVITRHGKPIAKLVKPEIESDEERKVRARQAVQRIKELRETIKPLGDISIGDIINEGRRF